MPNYVLPTFFPRSWASFSFHLCRNGTKVLHLVGPDIVVLCTTYVESISFVGFLPFLRVIMAYKSLVVQIVRVVFLGVPTAPNLGHDLPTFGMTIPGIPALCLVMSFILRSNKRLKFCDGFIYGLACRLSNSILAQFFTPSIKWSFMSSSVRLGIWRVLVLNSFKYAIMLPVCFNYQNMHLTLYTTLLRKKPFLNFSWNSSNVLMVHVPFQSWIICACTIAWSSRIGRTR